MKMLEADGGYVGPISDVHSSQRLSGHEVAVLGALRAFRPGEVSFRITGTKFRWAA
jgi:hypothetical protein